MSGTEKETAQNLALGSEPSNSQSSKPTKLLLSDTQVRESDVVGCKIGLLATDSQIYIPPEVRKKSTSFSELPIIFKFYEDVKRLLSMGSKSKPPVLQIGEYPQWRVRMIQFLNNIDKTLMVSIQEGPIKPYIDIPGTPKTATTPAIEPRRVFKLFRHYNELEKIRAELDDKALTLLTMAIPNDLFNRVDSRNTAKELSDELEKQFKGRRDQFKPS
ncbi:hypothetical protein OSB04_006883 [Centaurea solstitialis]|uniref:Uncharacterized protein n=1 Tax=Centaurea solstitialis TaxID=347529 RepID=A0AA38TRF1_9ASTR|nr:hypothetical protein OSB04_006883 [Centaurea solstitialis]